MIPRTLVAFVFIMACASVPAQKIPVSVLAQQSEVLTNLTAPDAPPFHLKATISIPELTKKTGSLEEYWVSPTKWRRTIQIPTFSQTVIVNGADRYEKNDGEYFPVGLQTIAQAIVQPIPDTYLTALEQSKVKLDMYGGQLPKADICDSNFQQQNQILLEVCFSGEKQSISVMRFPFYDVSLKERQAFGNYYVARHLTVGENGGIRWEATVDDMSPLKEVDESLFRLPEVTPKEKQFKLLEIQENDFRNHFRNLPAIQYPDTPKPIRGVITMFISMDKDGYIAEAWPSSEEYPEIAKSIHDQVESWATNRTGGGFVQLETWLTFAFQTHVANAHPDANSPTP